MQISRHCSYCFLYTTIYSFPLQSPEKIYIKVVELEPKITTLGENFDESLQMQREHDETLRNLQVSLHFMHQFTHL